MNAQQLHDYIIKPTLGYMGGNYNTVEARFLLLCTAAIESNCGYFIKQINGPALGPWQNEPLTHEDIWDNCDALQDLNFAEKIASLGVGANQKDADNDLVTSPMYACAMARLKYSMDPNPLPKLKGDKGSDLLEFYKVYKSIYNTRHGKSTYEKWVSSIISNNILEVDLNGGES